MELAACDVVTAQHRIVTADNFDAVVRLYWPRIFRFAFASLRDRDAAESVAQDCFLKAYLGRQNFRGEASLQTWLMQIAANLVRDHARNRRAQFWRRTVSLPYMTSPADDGISPERRTLIRERVDHVWLEAARLPERQQTVFKLRFVDELQLLEIAQLTGLTEGAVKVHLFRALRTVRARLAAVAMALLMLGGVLTFRDVQRTRATAQEKADAALMQQVSAALSRPVPRALSPLIGN